MLLLSSNCSLVLAKVVVCPIPRWRCQANRKCQCIGWRCICICFKVLDTMSICIVYSMCVFWTDDQALFQTACSWERYISRFYTIRYGRHTTQMSFKRICSRKYLLFATKNFFILASVAVDTQITHSKQLERA